MESEWDLWDWEEEDEGEGGQSDPWQWMDWVDDMLVPSP